MQLIRCLFHFQFQINRWLHVSHQTNHSSLNGHTLQLLVTMDSSRSSFTMTPDSPMAKPCRLPSPTPQKKKATMRGVGWAARAAMRPLREIRQAWLDYKAGRALRRENGEPLSDHYQGGTKNAFDSSSEKGGLPGLLPTGGITQEPLSREWDIRPTQDSPWKIWRIFDAEERRRGQWVLEVDLDLCSTDWVSEHRDGKRLWRFEVSPPLEGSTVYYGRGVVASRYWDRVPDELREWLERP